MLDTIFQTSDRIQNNRSLTDIFTYLVEEVGELATEVNIKTGYSTKQQGKDGIVGEAVDAIICLVDLIHQYDSSITSDQVMDVVERKLTKWEYKGRKG